MSRQIFCFEMWWTPAKMLLLADVNEYSFANAGIYLHQSLCHGDIEPTWPSVNITAIFDAPTPCCDVNYPCRLLPSVNIAQTGQGLTGFQDWLPIRGQLRFWDHMAQKTGLQDGGNWTEKCTHKMTILAQFMTLYSETCLQRPPL